MKLAFSAFLASFLILATPALAQLCTPKGGTTGKTGVETAIGCLAAGEPYLLVGQLLGWGTIVGAGIAFIMLLIGGGQIAMAAGDPKKVQAAKELITAALTGLLLIIFSILLVNLIGIKILGLGPSGLGILSP